jgi:hypothetical protein
MRPDPKSSLAGLRHRLDYRFTQPEQLDRDTYRALDPGRRQAYDSLRLEWFGAGFWVKTADTMDLLRSVKGYLRTTHVCAVGERNLVLDGSPTSAKPPCCSASPEKWRWPKPGSIQTIAGMARSRSSILRCCRRGPSRK